MHVSVSSSRLCSSQRFGLLSGALILAMALGGAILFLSVPAEAKISNHVRLLFHSDKQLKDSPWGISGWVLAPDVTSAPDKWLTVAGPRYNGTGWWVEMMAGGVIQAGSITSMIDMRASVKRLAPWLFWANLEWINLNHPSKSVGYAFAMANYVLPGKIALLGLETEDFFPKGGDAKLSVGPHVIFPFKDFAFVFAYQFHNKGDDQVWVRMIMHP